MKETPILFSAEMVRAILDGRKTQTRRIIKPQPFCPRAHIVKFQGYWCVSGGYMNDADWKPMARTWNCPYGQPGDRLWVKETFQEGTDIKGYGCIVYRADNKAFSVLAKDHGDGDWCAITKETTPMECPIWKPSIFMPRWASRITLEVTQVRVQRVREISEEDAKAEGVNGGCLGCGEDEPCGCSNPQPCYRETYVRLWDELNAKRGYGWDINPWVWAITFKRV